MAEETQRLVPMGPPRRKATDLPVYTWTEWDSVDRVKAALLSLEQGQFLPAAQLVDAMGRDDRISGVLNTRVNGMLGLPVDVADDKAEKVTRALKDGRSKMFPKAQARRLLRSGIMLGVGLAENIWTRTETSWTPRLKVWHPQFVQWRWDTRSFWVSTMEGFTEITPGDGHWVMYTPYGDQLGWLDGMVRSLSVPWLIRQWARRDWARYSEVHGLPIRVGIVPNRAKAEDKDRFIEELAQIGSESVIRTPAGPKDDGTTFDVKLLEASSQSWEGFQALLHVTSTDIAVALLGQNLTTEVKEGSRAAAQVHENVRQDVLEADATTIDDCFHEQTVQPWALYNFGDKEAAPVATYHTDPPENLASRATAMQTLGNALSGFKTVRAPVDVGQVLVDFGIPVVEGAPMPDLTEEPEPAETDPALDPAADPEKK